MGLQHTPERIIAQSSQFTTKDIQSHFGLEFGSFLHAFDAMFGQNPETMKWLNDLFVKRNQRIFTTVQHFSWLLPRCYQYLFVRDDVSLMSELGKLSEEEWGVTIADIHKKKIVELEFLLLNRIVATFVPNRYAALGAVLSTLMNSRSFMPKKFVDLGCSANLGIGTVFQDSYMPEIVDPSGLWQTNFRENLPEEILGIDVQRPDLLWTACSSWPGFVAEAYELLVERKALIDKSPFSVNFLLANIADADYESILRQTSPGYADVVHASLVQYLLPQEKRDIVTRLVELLLAEGGYLIETDMFKFGTNFNTPLSVESRFRVKREGKLSEPITIIRHAKHETLERGPSDSCRTWFPDDDGLRALQTAGY